MNWQTNMTLDNYRQALSMNAEELAERFRSDRARLLDAPLPPLPSFPLSPPPVPVPLVPPPGVT